MNDFPFITVLTLTPAVGAVLLLFLRRDQARLARGVAVGFAGLALLEAVLLWFRFDPLSPELQWAEKHQWIEILGVQYFVGLDGLGLLMVLLSALVVPFALLTPSAPETRTPGFYSLVLGLQTGLFGSFTALNFFHWFIFWELGLIPAYFLIKLWGGNRRREAATQFFVYTMVGSVTLLLAFLALQMATGTFDFLVLAKMSQSGQLKAAVVASFSQTGMSAERLLLCLFLGAFLGFAVKVPLIPFHSWLPDAYAEAPTSITMILTGVMSKMGV